jgi:hypothetical protein
MAWEGRDVEAKKKGLEGVFSNKSIQIDLTDQAARDLALALGRLTQTTLPLTGNMEELRQALNFILVGDPMSRASHRRMEAGKGMTPDGGYKTPENLAPREIRGTDGRSKF